MSNNIYSKLHTYMKNGFNVLCVGPAGTGKTSLVKKACKELGLKMKYIDASLADEFVDLVGIPIPDRENKIIEFFKTNDLMDAEVIVVDELNRGSRGFRNGILEAALEQSLKGERLPNLKLMVAMMNPNEEGYQVDDLDIALVDRFDARLYFEPTIDTRYFTDTYNKEVAKTVKKWWNDYNKTVEDKSKKNKKVYISPRRMDKIVAGFQKIPHLDTIKDFMPEGVVGNLNGLFNDLNLAFGFTNEDEIEREREARKAALREKNRVHLNTIPNMSKTEIRTVREKAVMQEIQNSDPNDPDFRPAIDAIFDAIVKSVGADRLARTWAPVIKYHFTDTQRQVLKDTWNSQKINEYNKLNKEGDTL